MTTLTADKTEKDAAMAAAAEGTDKDAAKGKRGASVTWTIEGAPPAGKTTYHLARLALQCTGGIVEGKKKLSVAELRKLLADAGITDPEHTTWSFTLPNGKTIGAIADGETVPEPKPRRVPAEKSKSAGSSKKAAERIETLEAHKDLAKAAKESGAPIPSDVLAKTDAPKARKMAEARRTRKAPAAVAS